MKRRVLLYKPSPALQDALQAIPGWRSAIDLIPGLPGKPVPEQVKESRPELLLLDVDGLGHETKRVVADTMRSAPLPILLVADYAHQGPEAVIDALSEGAKDFVESPLSQGRRAGRARQPEDIVARIDALLERRRPGPMPDSQVVVVVGVSTGGPSALGTLLAGMPSDLPAALLIVQHMPSRFTGPLAERLDGAAPLTVREARADEVLSPGVALLAPGGHHLEVGPHGRIDLSDPEPESRFVPSIDLAMVSTARVFGPGVIGVLLTGMGKDGILGLRAVRMAGGKTLAQDEASSVMYGMPKVAAELGLADGILPLHELAAEIDRVARRTDRFLRRARP